MPATMTVEELNLLANLNEECSEVITEAILVLSQISKETMKAVRFGLTTKRGDISGNPEHTDSPIIRMSNEMGQVEYLLLKLRVTGMIDENAYYEGYNKKREAFESKRYKPIEIVNNQVTTGE